VRVLDKHRLAMSEIAIMANLNVSIWWLRVRAQFDASTPSGKSIEWR